MSEHTHARGQELPRYFISGIDTDIGKTLVAAVVTKALAADYWKPVQCGNLETSDSKTIARLLGDVHSGTIFREVYALPEPLSPHLAAKRAGCTIALDAIKMPPTSRPLVIEGAGGVLVPLNDQEMVIDIAKKFSAPVIVVTKNYLGSLNHTFLTVEVLRQRGLAIAGLVFNGHANPELEDFVAMRTDLPILLRVPQCDAQSDISPEFVTQQALRLRRSLGL